MSSKLKIKYSQWEKEVERNPQLIAAKRVILNSHYGIDPKPQTLYISSACYSDKTNLMLQELRESLDMSQNKAITEESFWQLADSPFEWINGFIREQREGELYSKNDCLATMEALKYYNEIKKQQEETKMNAKRCDRCGKLYIPTDDAPIRAYLCGRVTEHEKETYLPEKNKEFNTYDISIRLNNSGSNMDMCPDCCKKLKEFFESGAEETKE